MEQQRKRKSVVQFIREHINMIIKIAVVIALLTLASYYVHEFFYDAKQQRLTNEILKQEQKLDSISNSIENSLLLEKDLNRRINESMKRSLNQQNRLNELILDYENIRKQIQNATVDDSYIIVSEYLKRQRTRNQKENIK